MQQTFIDLMPADYCVVKLEFNTSHRDAMLDVVLEKIPVIYKFCHLPYSRPSEIIYNGYINASREWTQLGDPLGASLFCGTIHQLLLSP
jgi:hypothetical protein